MKCKHSTFLTCAILGTLLLTNACYRAATVTDIDGNVYTTVKIGKQTWMAENLRATHYRNGCPLPLIKENALWCKSQGGAFCFYRNVPSNLRRYGLLYNWYAVNDSRGLAPAGWHIPSATEVASLAEFLKGDAVAAGKMRLTGPETWLGLEKGSTNESGFSAMPGGYRSGNDGSYHTLGVNGYWWSTTRSYEIFHWSTRLYHKFADIDRDSSAMKAGFAVRCIKD